MAVQYCNGLITSLQYHYTHTVSDDTTCMKCVMCDNHRPMHTYTIYQPLYTHIHNINLKKKKAKFPTTILVFAFLLDLHCPVMFPHHLNLHLRNPLNFVMPIDDKEQQLQMPTLTTVPHSYKQEKQLQKQ